MTAPAPPTNVTATVDANDSITVSWDYDPVWFAFDGDDNTLGGFDEGYWYGSGSVDHYEIQLTRDANGWTDPAGGPTSVTDDGSTSYSASYGPNSDNSYNSVVGIDSMFKFHVRAVNADGSSSWATSGKVYTEAIPPHNPSVSRPDNMSFTFSWENKSDIGDGPVVEARKDTGNGYGSWDWISTLDGSGSDTISQGDGENISIEEDARYQFQIYHHVPEDRSKDSKTVFCDYGNSGNVYFSDDFESADLSSWDSNNLAGDTGVQSVAGDADLQINGADEGSYYFYGEGEGSGDGTWIQKDLGDLSSETDVHVRCAFATASLDNIDENFGVSWYDGSSWQPLEHKGSEYNRQGWYELQALVPSSYLSSDNRIRVGTTTSTGMYGGDHFAVDRVVVSDILHEYTAHKAPTLDSVDASVEGEVSFTASSNSTFKNRHHTRLHLDGSKVSGQWALSGTFTGLSDGEEYRVSVRNSPMQHRHGVRDYWMGSKVSGSIYPITRLPAPTALSASNITPTSADLSWTDNADNEDAKRVYLEQEGSPAGMKFGNSGSDVVKPDFNNPGGSDTLTLTTLFKEDSHTSWARTADFGDSSNDYVFISPYSGGSTVEAEITTNSNKGQLDSGVTLTTGTIHRATLTYDGSTARLYVDGTEQANTSFDKSISNNISWTNNLIGQSQYSDGVFDGVIYEVAWWNRSLSSSEVSSLDSEIPSNGLIGYWPLDHDYAGVTHDLSEYANDGSVNGPSLTGTENAMDFERSNNDRVDLGVVGNELEFGTGDFSLATKVTFESTGDYRTILELSRYTDSLLFRPDNDQCDIYINGDSWQPTVGFTAGETYELILTRTNGTVELFIDGTSQGTSTLDGDMNIDQESYIGASVHNSSQSFDGEIHYLQMYNKSLSSSERSQIRGGKPVADGLVGYWPLATIGDDGTTPDVSGYGNHGDVLGPSVVGDRPMDAGVLSPAAATKSVGSLLDDTTYDAYVHTETEHSTTRDN